MRATQASMCSGSFTSHSTAIASPPAASITFTTASHLASVRLDTATRAPARASAMHTPRPTPEPPPVTIATLPSSIDVAMGPPFPDPARATQCHGAGARGTLALRLTARPEDR